MMDKRHEQNDVPRLALREREAAQALSISPRKLWELANRGVIRAVKIDGTKVYPIVELNRWLSEQIGGE